MKDKRQRMALTWPYADPHFAAYMFAAAATAAAYGHQPTSYWNRGVAPYQSPSMMVMRPGAPTTGITAGLTPGPTSQSPFMSPAVGLSHGRVGDPITTVGNSCCASSVCRGCNSPENPMSSSLSINRSSHSPDLTLSKPLFQPYKSDIDK